MQVDHNAAALNASLGHVFNAQRAGAELPVAGGAADVFTGPETVVINRFGHAIAIGVKFGTHMAQAIPLCRILAV